MKHNQPKLFALITTMMIVAVFLAACAPIVTSAAAWEANQASQPPAASKTEAKKTAKIDPLVFQQAVRKLWEQHVTWTRDYIISALADLPETNAAAQRLLQNQVDIGMPSNRSMAMLQVTSWQGC